MNLFLVNLLIISTISEYCNFPYNFTIYFKDIIKFKCNINLKYFHKVDSNSYYDIYSNNLTYIDKNPFHINNSTSHNLINENNINIVFFCNNPPCDILLTGNIYQSVKILNLKILIILWSLILFSILYIIIIKIYKKYYKQKKIGRLIQSYPGDNYIIKDGYNIL